MKMVSANSQLAPVHGLFVNSVNNQCIFIQLVHNTDDDSLILMLITDWNTYNCQMYNLDKISHPLWVMIF